MSLPALSGANSERISLSRAAVVAALARQADAAQPPPARQFPPTTGAAFGRCGSFSFFFVLSLFAEFIANDKPILVFYKGEYLFPIFQDYPEEKFGGFLAQDRLSRPLHRR